MKLVFKLFIAFLVFLIGVYWVVRAFHDLYPNQDYDFGLSTLFFLVAGLEVRVQD